MVSDNGKETENIDNGKETESETCSSPISRQVEYVDENVLECREEDEDKQSLNKVS